MHELSIWFWIVGVLNNEDKITLFDYNIVNNNIFACTKATKHPADPPSLTTTLLINVLI